MCGGGDGGGRRQTDDERFFGCLKTYLKREQRHPAYWLLLGISRSLLIGTISAFFLPVAHFPSFPFRIPNLLAHGSRILSGLASWKVFLGRLSLEKDDERSHNSFV